MNVLGMNGMGRALLKVKGGKLVKVQLTQEKGRIQKIRITGDFFLHPEEVIDELEQALVGKPLEAENILQTIKTLIREKNVTLLGVSPEDFVKCVLMACDKNG
jgi:lipoate-protein ligase A